ncbi:thioredoxin family protein [Halosegnis marinus]|uniref:Thioredoxin family protein n=1 Tax=Halosegnis marinus TaxID=3034023 RepID=A0ABD5ZRZ8_9EURY|nr:thioredoxin family protein [Halosegnis sp. DT85]
MVQAESESELHRGDVAPDFRLDGTDGASYTPDSFADNDALLVVFTCNHCPYAKAKFGALNAIAADYDDCAVVGINPNDAEEYPDDSYERMCELVDDGTVAYDAYLRDDDASVADAYGAVCTPDPFLFGREDGEWVLKYHGRLDDALNPDDEPSGGPGSEARRAIDAVLAGEDVELDDNPSRGCSIKWPEA